MIPDDLPLEKITDSQRAQVMEALFAYATEKGLSLTYFAKELGISSATLSLVRRGLYTGDWRNVVVDADRCLDEHKKRDAAPKTTGFIWTNVAEEIRAAADMATANNLIALVYGPTTSGIGKTMALQAIAASKPGSIFITIDKASSTSNGMLRNIASELKVATYGGVSLLYERIRQKLAGTSRFLIIDQIHNLCGKKGDEPFFILADLWDRTHAPQLWCGTNDIVAYLDRRQARGQESLAQIRRRIGISLDLMDRTRDRIDPDTGRTIRGEPLFSVEEVRRVFAKNQMRMTPEASLYLAKLANLEDAGALGLCAQLVRNATIIFSEDQKAMTVAMLKATHRKMLNNRAYTFLESRLIEQQRPMAIARSA